MKKIRSILITGANGQLGLEFQQISKRYSNFNFHFFSREELSITDESAIISAIESASPDLVINCAAYTAVDLAEKEQELAYAVNARAPSLLAQICAQNDVRFIHISTDYVFNGRSKIHYKEDDKTDPQSVYGKTKLEGEKLVMRNDPAAIVIRTSWVYSEFGKNFVKTMIRIMGEKPEVSVVNDQFGSPTYAADLAEVIIHIANANTWTPGIYHFSNEGIISWFDFAEAIRDIQGLQCKVNAIPTSSYPTPAVRPAFSGLDKSRIRTTYNTPIKYWKDSLKECIERLNKKE